MEYFVQISGKRKGPYNLEELLGRIRSGELRQGYYLLADDRSILLRPEHIQELSALVAEKEAKKRHENFRRWLNRTLAFSTPPPGGRSKEMVIERLRRENQVLTERLANLEEEVRRFKESDAERERELRRILEKKAAADEERRRLETVKERLERDEKAISRRRRSPVYAAVFTVFAVITGTLPLWYFGVHKPSEEAGENERRSAETYDRARNNLTEILFLRDRVQVLYEKLNRLDNTVKGTYGETQQELTPAELKDVTEELAAVNARIEKAVGGYVSVEVLVLPNWPSGDDPARSYAALEEKLKPRRNLVLSAYGTALAEDPAIRGYVLVSAEIDRDGSVDAVDIKKSTIDEPSINDACKKTFEFTNFGKASADTTCLFKFAFDPEG